MSDIGDSLILYVSLQGESEWASSMRRHSSKSSMRKSDGSVIDSSEDDEFTAVSGGGISRSSTTSSFGNFLMGYEDLEGSAKAAVLAAAPFYLGAVAGSIKAEITVKVGENAIPQLYNSDPYLCLSRTEILLRRLVPYQPYMVSWWTTPIITTSPTDGAGQFLGKRVFRILPVKSLRSPHVNDQIAINTFKKPRRTLAELIGNLPGGRIDTLTAFELLGVNNYQEKSVIARVEAPVEAIPIAREVKLARIDSNVDGTSIDDEDINALLKKHFKTPKLLTAGGLLRLAPEKAPEVFFEVTFTLKSDAEPLPDITHQACLTDPSTSFYQLPPIRRHCPRKRVNRDEQFVPQNLRDLSTRIFRLLKPQFETKENVENTFMSMPVVSVLAASPGSGGNLALELLAEALAVEVVKIDCLNYWNIEGKNRENEIKADLESALAMAPAVFVVENVTALKDAPGSSLDSGNKTLDKLCKSVSKLSAESNLAVTFTCEKTDLAELPQALAQLVHFEFVLPDLDADERTKYYEFLKKHQNLSEEVTIDKFLALTRGFVLAELDQVTLDCRRQQVILKSDLIQLQFLEKAVEKRNKSFSDAIGAPKIPNVKWDDVGGLEDVKKAIAESLKLNLKPSASKGLKRSGIVLYGPPGCGKTLLAKAVANQFGVTFLSVKGPELLNQYVGQSEQNLRIIFEKARLASPSIVFFDEMDSLAPNRGAADDSGGVMDRMVSQLLAELDTLHSTKNCDVFIMAATNRPDLLDPALLIPGRFDKAIHVRPATDIESKLRILRPLSEKVTLDDGITVEDIAKMCPELMSGADLSSLMQKSAMAALREVILNIEADPEASKNIDLNEIQVKIGSKHVHTALQDFAGSLSKTDLDHYANLENQL
uniref:Peroxisomal ATPase PEX6 n=1 Tax=Panagrellus redivivus TaxID=6233 RepID=A0A7E4VJ66_PANRE